MFEFWKCTAHNICNNCNNAKFELVKENKGIRDLISKDQSNHPRTVTKELINKVVSPKVLCGTQSLKNLKNIL